MCASATSSACAMGESAPPYPHAVPSRPVAHTAAAGLNGGGIRSSRSAGLSLDVVKAGKFGSKADFAIRPARLR